MMHEEMLEGGDERDAYRLAVGQELQDDNRTAAGQVKSIRRMPVARSVGQASKLTEMLDIEILRQEISIDDHKIGLHDLFNRLLTDPVTGLTFQQVNAILQRDGANVISAPLEPPTWVRFSKNIFGGFSFMLWLGALLCFAHYSIQSGEKIRPVSSDTSLTWEVCLRYPRKRPHRRPRAGLLPHCMRPRHWSFLFRPGEERLRDESRV